MRALARRARGVHQLVRQTLDEFARHRSALLAAALAYHTLICMAPLVIVAVAIAGIVFGRGEAHAELQRLLEETLGPHAASEIDARIVDASAEGEVAGAVGLALTLLAASKLGTQLRHVLNQIRDVEADPFVPGVLAYVRRRLFAMATAFAVGPILVLFLLSRAVLAALPLERFVGHPSHWSLPLLQLGASLVILSAASAAAFRYIPDALLRWGTAWVGGALTSVLVSGGSLVLSRYFGQTNAALAYEAAGSGLVVLLWLYFSAYSFLMGAELAQVLESRAHAERRPVALGAG